MIASVLAERTIAALSKLSHAERDVVLERVLRADPELGPVLRAYITVKRLRAPMRRDSVV